MVTTIQLSEKMKKKIASFGSKEDTYEQILERIYTLACREHVRMFLMDDSDCVPIEDALKRAKAKWRK